MPAMRHIMIRLPTAMDCRKLRWLLISFSFSFGCGGARQPPPSSAEGARDGGAPAAPDAGAPSDSGATAREPPAPDACDVAQTAARTTDPEHDFAQSVRRARAEVGNLPAAPFGERAQRSAEVLRAVALALASAPATVRDDAERLCQLTEQADALVAEGGAPFEGSAQIERGLSLALELLRAHAERTGAERLPAWLDTAEGAVQRIDGESMVAFQGAEIQDAFRTTVDALTVLAQEASGAL